MESDKIDLDKKSQPSCLGAVMLSCSKEKLIKGLKEALIGYQKNVGKYESEFEFIQNEDFEEIAQDLIDFCN